MNIEINGILGLVLFALVVYAIVKTLQSGASTGGKVLWIVIVLLLPFLGFLAWLLFGPKARN